jgi:hypothetical protein
VSWVHAPLVALLMVMVDVTNANLLTFQAALLFPRHLVASSVFAQNA